MVTRIEPMFQLPERESYRLWLDYHRATLETKCEGLTDEQLRLRSVPPSELSLLGLVRHMAGVELWWFRCVLGGEPDDETGNEFEVERASVEESFAAWRDECAHARVVADGMGLDDTVVIHENGERDGMDISLRWVYVHMIEEYARHNGHADFLRECIDGATGE